MADRVGQRFGDYRLIRFLGGGGFGDVYLGEHIHDKTLAAVKVLKTHLKDETDLKEFVKKLKEFINEASTFNLKHPHIAQLLAFGLGKDDIPFLVIEYAPNGSLRSRYPRGTRLPLDTIVTYLKPIAAALQYAHDHRRIHRDVKPENILLGPNNKILLSDFGIAAFVHSTDTWEEQKRTGTLVYMAPEQIRGKAQPASDQYALGIMVYEWLCGAYPFSGDELQVMYQHLEVPPPPLHEKIPTIPPEVEQVVMTALAKDYKQRFGSVQAFARALEQASQISPASPPAPPTAPIAADPPSQVVPPAEMSTPASHTAVPTGMVAPANPPVMPREMARPTIPSAAPTGMSTPASPTAGPTEAITPASRTSLPPIAYPIPQASVGVSPLPGEPVAPDEPVPAQRGISRRTVVLGLIVLGAVAAGGATWLVLTSHPRMPATPTPPPGTTLLTYKGHSDTVCAVAWSPDGRRVASGSDDHTVQVWDATTGANTLTYKGHSDTVYAVAWSPDGRRLASGGRDKTVQVWSAG